MITVMVISQPPGNNPSLLSCSINVARSIALMLPETSYVHIQYTSVTVEMKMVEAYFTRTRSARGIIRKDFLSMMPYACFILQC